MALLLSTLNNHPRDFRICKIDDKYRIVDENGKPYDWELQRVTTCINSVKQDSDQFSENAKFGTCKLVKKLFKGWIDLLSNNPELCNHPDLHRIRANHFQPKHLVMFDLEVLSRFEQYVAQGKYNNPDVTTEDKIEFFGHHLIDKVKYLPLPDGKHFNPSSVVRAWNKQADLGTEIHAHAEDILNGKTPSFENKPHEYELLYNFFNDHKHINWYRTEYMIYDEDYRVAGTMDALALRDGKFAQIFDFKRSHVLKPDPNDDADIKRAMALKEPFQHLKSTKRTMFALQLSVYGLILERKYGYIVERLYIVVVYPYNDNYLVIEVPYYKDVAQHILENAHKLNSTFP